MDPLGAAPTCTSMTSWTNGNRGSASMNPGMACISCHSSGEGPAFNIAGTVYPTGHEPDRCNSQVGTQGAQIVITGADGKMLTLTPDGVGNFSSSAALKTPFQAKVTYQGRERSMVTPQSSGDCNSCHTQSGANGAPGRITVP
jgi:nitrate/TMAO reductase-like tetraheme cytochrome c subunit